MRVLITGSSGLIGTALKKALEAANIPFDIVERTSTSQHEITTIPTPGGPVIYRIHWPSGLNLLPYDQYSTVVHLAFGRPSPKDCVGTTIEQQVAPVRAILDSISRHHSSCSFLFMSSQSSTPDAVSGYGRGKWECEQTIRDSRLMWTIIRPGLVVSASHQGLFGAIKSALRWSPIIPVPCGESMRIQPVLLTDIVNACIKVISQPASHSGACYDLALPTRTLVAFTKEVCQASRLARVIVPIPWKLISAILRLSEYLSLPLPISRGNLEGLLAAREMESKASADALNMQLRDWTDDLLTPCSVQQTDAEAKHLFTAIFGFPPPTEVVARYNAAQQHPLLNGAWINIDVIIQEQLDAEAVEFASRSKKTILTQKMHIMCYVAELSPDLLPQFINRETCRLRAFAELGLSGIRSAWKLLYGTYLIKKYSLFTRAHFD